MKLRSVPFNVSILDPESDIFFGLAPVKALNMFDTQTGDFADDGLYSNEIFGRQGERERKRNMSFIDLKTQVFHPLYFEELSSLKELYGGIILGRSYARWNPKEKDFEPAPVLEGQTGIGFFLKHFKELKFKKNRSKKRTTKITFIEKFRDKALMRRHIVIPAGLRDVEFDETNRPVEDDLNPLYKRLISNANTIPAYAEDDEDETLNRTRASMQIAVNNVYQHLFGIIKGKRGFIMSKVASRKVAVSSRNVISSMEVGAEILGDAKQPTMDTVILGLPQFMASTRPLCIHHIKNGVYSDFFRSEGVYTQLVDKKSLNRVDVNLKPKTIDKWLTDEGLESLIASFGEPHIRHKPIEIDGHYLGLIYRDKTHYKVMRDISELPEGYDIKNVKPITYAEFFYTHVGSFVEKVRQFATRYPVTGSESIQAGRVYLKTTTTGQTLTRLSEDWQDTGETLLEFPDTAKGLAFFETQSVHPSGLSLYGGDFDGDVLSYMPVFGDESIKEIDAKLNDPSAYLSVTGGFIKDSGHDIHGYALMNATGYK